MPLQKNVIPVAFKSALSTKNDPKQLVTGELVVAENITFEEGLAFKKRNGYKLIGNAGDIPGGSYPSSGQALNTFNNELVMFDGLLAYSYAEQLNALLIKGFCSSIDVTTLPIVRSGYAQKGADSAVSTLNGLQVFVWEDQYGSAVRYTVIDPNTNQSIVPSSSILSSSIAPKVVYYNGQFVIFFLQGTELWYALLADTNPLQVLQPILFNTGIGIGVNPSYGYDVAAINGYLYVAYNHTSSGTITVKRMNTSFVVDASVDLPTVTNSAIAMWAIPNMTNQSFWVATSGAHGVDTFYVPYDLANYGSTSNVYSTAITGGSITGAVEGIYGDVLAPIPPSSVQYEPVVFFTVPDPNSGSTTTAIPQNNDLNAQIWEASGDGGTFNSGTIMSGSVGLASKATQQSFLYLNGAEVYIPMVIGAHASQFQNTYFMFPGQNTINAKIFPTNGGGMPLRFWALPKLNNLDNNTLQCALLEQESLTVTNGTVYAPTGVNSVVLQFNNFENQFANVELGSNLMISGGLPQMYDGLTVVEHNFNVFPEGISLLSAPLGGALAKGVYQYQVTYEWPDNQGQIHRSAPSVPIAPSTDANNPAFTADTTNTLDTYSFGGSCTNGTNTIITIPAQFPTVLQGDQIYPGCLVQDTGLAVLPNTFITGIAYNTPSSGQVTITLSQNVVGTFIDDVFTVTYTQLLHGTVEAASPIVRLAPIPEIYVFGNVVSGSPVVTVFSLAGLRVGLTLRVSPYFSGSPTISSINAAANQITLSSNATATSSIPTALPFDATFTGVVNGTPTDLIYFPNTGPNFDPGAAPLIAYAAANVGSDLVFTDYVPTLATINSASGSTINVDFDYTVSTAWEASNDVTAVANELVMGTNTFQIASGPTLVVGMKLKPNGFFPAGTYVTGVVGGVDITVSQNALVHAFSASIVYTIFAKGYFTGSGVDITSVGALTVAWAAANIGGSIDITGLLTTPATTPIVSASTPTIRVNMPYNNPATLLGQFPGNTQVILGQTIQDAIPADYIFSGVYTANSPTVSVGHAVAVFASQNIGAGVQSEGLASVGPPYPVLVSADIENNTFTMSANAINSGTSDDGTYNPSLFVFSSSKAFSGTPFIIKSYLDPTYPGVGVIEIDSKALQSYPNTAFGDELAPIQLNNTYAVMATLPTLRLTSKTNNTNPVSIVMYRSIVNSTEVFYETASVIQSNDQSINNVIRFDTNSDNSLAGGPGVLNSANQLYTTGGVLENTAGPSCTSLTTYQNRLVGIDSTNPLSIFYSQQVVPGTPVQFCPEFTINVDPRGGDCTALINMDDKLIIFKETFIFYMTGTGPNALGQQNDFSDTFFVTSDCGCVDPQSVVVVPSGVMFKSTKGIMLLDRSLKVSYIGSPVERFNNFNVTSAALIPSTNQVRFTLHGTDTTLVFDYFFGLWGTFTNIEAADSCIFQGLFTWVGTDGLIHQETPNVFTDAGAAISMHLKTGWISFAGIQGFQRVYKMDVLGEYVTPHTLNISAAYDFNPNFSQTAAITSASLLGSPFGSRPAFGDGEEPFGGYYPRLQYRFFPIQQKCEAVQIDIYDTPTSPVGEGVQLSNLSFEVGQKTGVFKLPASRSSG